MVDQVANFKKVTVSTGYNNTATSIVLATGQGAELPDPSGDNYNVVWWDSTNYPDPADDPNVEVIRVTAKTTDTLTVNRNQESSGASNKNNADATYKMILATTAKTITDITDTLQIDSINNEVGIGTAPVSGSSLALPLHGDAITPTLSFGDGDTGLYENSDDALDISIAGSRTYEFTAAGFLGIAAGAYKLINVLSSDTVPTVCPNRGDEDTGLGRAGADQLSLIAGGVEGLRLTESGSAVAISGAIVNTANGVSQLVAAPAAANSTGTAGQIAYDASFFYVCIATDTWERVGIASW